ncbi:SAF domain-containing protein [Cytobacillus firmus]|uniref:SAF domain-containing protein n=1 Tax=Cytobacillus oceanisediminis TaxID=665099 RepID=A0ABX3CKI4_9BACI|nr:SAF domain-containing protein [Cytobacillus oceanisediminis]OHX41369.1 hypothetical protein BBV17_28645 [Cytobacillus oceanisediminis]
MKKTIFMRGLAVFLIISFIAYIFLYETKLHGMLNTSTVVFANKDFEPNEVIGEDDIYLGKYPNELLHEKVIVDPKEIVGQRATGFISVNDIFTEKKVDSPLLRAKDGEKFFAIPNSWIETIPGSLRRLDMVDLWLVQTDKSRPESNQFSVEKPILEGKVVAFIKNSSNTEVKGINSEKDRLDAGSQASQLEINMTNEEFIKVKKSVEAGYKLIFSY